MLKCWKVLIFGCVVSAVTGCLDGPKTDGPNQTQMVETQTQVVESYASQEADNSKDARVTSDDQAAGNAITEDAHKDQASVKSESSGSGDPVPEVETKPGELVSIKFEDIELPMKEDMVFRPQLMLTDRAKELDGERVRISGFMYPSSKFRGIKQFIMVKNTECKYGPGGRADHLINVTMNDDKTTFFREEAIEIEGKLTIKPFNGPDGNTWSIYDLACESVEKFRPRR